jgi:hypothetical protein
MLELLAGAENDGKEERAAILHFDAGISRATAERLASFDAIQSVAEPAGGR